MDAFAARQLEKRKLKEEKERKENELLNKPYQDRLSKKEKDSLNKLFGFPEPPEKVFALGKDQAAAVWWPYVPEVTEIASIADPTNDTQVPDDSTKEVSSTLLGWEIHRYRKDKSKPNGEWLYKGHTSYKPMEKTQVIIDSLTNDYEYRFTVKSLNAKGASPESIPSNPVMVEAPLPSGWHRFYDKEKHRHYYANIKLGRSSWSRPETDPFFLDQSILFNFEPAEIDALKALYVEDIAHFKCITVTQFMDILREIGEKCSKRWITQLFKGYAKDEEKLVSWTHFMEVINHIKKQRLEAGGIITKPFQSFLLFFSRKKIRALMQPKALKMGDWKMVYSALAGRYYYKNMRTDESFWSMPAQVKFYIPPKLEAKLLKVFDYGQIEEFQQYFSLLDVDGSGDLSDREIRILLAALNIKLSDKKFNKLIKTIDLNGNGTIEFDEYCWMMYEIYRKDKSQYWQGVQESRKHGNKKSTRQKDAVAAAANKNNLLEDSSASNVYNLEDNSYHEGDFNSMLADKALGSLNFNAVKYSILGLKESDNSLGSRYRIPDMFKSFRRTASMLRTASSRRFSVNSALTGDENDYSMSSVGNRRQSGTEAGGLVRGISQMFKRRKRPSTVYESQLNSLQSPFDDTRVIAPSVAAAKKRGGGVSFSGSFAYHGSFGAPPSFDENDPAPPGEQQEQMVYNLPPVQKPLNAFSNRDLAINTGNNANPKPQTVQSALDAANRAYQKATAEPMVHKARRVSFSNRAVEESPQVNRRRSSLVKKVAPPSGPPPVSAAAIAAITDANTAMNSFSPLQKSRKQLLAREGSTSDMAAPSLARETSMKGGQYLAAKSTSSTSLSVSTAGKKSPVSSPAMRRGSSKKVMPAPQEDSSDEEEDEEASGSQGRRRGSSFSLIRSLSTKMFGGGEDKELSEGSAKPHSKHCMCGCRSY